MFPNAKNDLAISRNASWCLRLQRDADHQRILYLDDYESLVFLVQRLLERRGYPICDFTDQRDVLAALRAWPVAFDLLVSGYNMPRMSGLDMARAAPMLRAAFWWRWRLDLSMRHCSRK